MRTPAPQRRVAPPLALVVATLVLLSTVAGLRAVAAATPKQEAAALSVVAGAKAKSGDYKLCAEMYAQCYRMDPSFLGYLYSAARCAQKGGQLDLAERHYRAFLLRAPKEHPLRPRTDKHMVEIMAARKAAAAKREAAQRAAAEAALRKKQAQASGHGSDSGSKDAGKSGDQLPGGGVTAKATPRSTQAWLGWASVGGGVVAGAVGAVLLLRANADAAALRADLKLPAGSKLISKLTYAEAAERRDAVASSSRMGGAAIGVGAALAAAGAVLLWTDTPRATSSLHLSPIPGNMQAVWEFRW